MINLKKQMRAMETETIQKNEVSPKDLNRRSRGNFLVFGMVLLAFCFFANNTMAQTWNIGNPGYNANVKATLSGNTLTISGTGNMCDFWDSTEGEAPWYVNRTSIQAVTIQSGVTNIGNRAFHDCNNLRTISIPNTVAIIGRQAFFNCTNTNFQLITLPNSVAEIEGEAFKNCTSLKTLIIDEGSSNLKFTRFRYPDKSGGTYFYGWFENCPIQTLSLRRQCSYDGGTLFSGNNYLQTLIIGRNVTSIGSSAFADCGGLKNVTLEEGSQNLLLGSRDAETVFSNCPILTLSLGRKICTYYHGVVGGALSFSASVKSPFYNKTTLKTVSIENSITSIEGYTFDGCNSLSSVSIGNIVASIGDAAFRNCSALTNISIPNSVTALGSSAFSGSGLTSIIIPASITNIGGSAFADCSGLKNVTLLEGSQNLLFGSRDAETVFSNCPIITLSLGRKIYTHYNGVVGGAASFSTSFKSPFYNKTTLDMLSIGSNTPSITDYTFYGCTGLTQITSNATTPPTIQSNTFTNVSRTINVKVPCNYLNAYRANQYWNTFTNMNDGGCTSGIADITTVNFQIYPNPAQDEIFIQSELLIQEVEIYDISGRLVETLRARSLPNNVQTINVSALPRGVYMLRIYTDKGLTNSKFMKE